MKVLVTRINSGRVVVDGKVTGAIDFGMAVFAGLEKSDTPDSFAAMAEKIVNFRIFEDEAGKMNHSLLTKKYPVLCISNFTLCASTEKGRRPSFENAMDKTLAQKCFPDFVQALKNKGLKVETGEFGAHMDIDLNMNGPVNIFLS